MTKIIFLLLVLTASTFPQVSRQFRMPIVNAHPGASVTVPVEVLAGGNEVFAQTTIHFDTSKLSISESWGVDNNPDIVVGDGVPENTQMIVYERLPGSGDVAFISYFNGCGCFPFPTITPGARQVAVLTFHVKKDAPLGPTEVEFTNGVIDTKMSDEFAINQPITARINGIIFITRRR